MVHGPKKTASSLQIVERLVCCQSFFTISVADSAAVLLPVFLIPQRKITGSDSIEVELEVEGKGEMARMYSCYININQ